MNLWGVYDYYPSLQKRKLSSERLRKIVGLVSQSQSFWCLGCVASALYSPVSLSVCIIVTSLTHSGFSKNVSSFPRLKHGGGTMTSSQGAAF